MQDIWYLDCSVDISFHPFEFLGKVVELWLNDSGIYCWRKKKVVHDLSKTYEVRRLNLSDVEEVYELCRKNTLYYEYCPPFITREGVKGDMEALPPGKTCEDKFFLGFYDEEKLIAIMDLIMGYPNDSTLYIGLFMTEVSIQGKGIGTSIIQEFCDSGKAQGYERVELAWVKGNPQSERFWKKNGFVPIGERSSTAAEHVIAAERKI